MRTPARIGIDVGGTTIKALALDPDDRVLGEERVATPVPDPAGRAVVAAVARLARALGHEVGDPVGVALPGVVDEAAGVAVLSVNVGWRDLDVLPLLVGALGPGVVLTHDVRAGAVAEVRTGAAADVDGVVGFVPVGTGVAAAILVDGVPLVSGGWAGEIGQVLLGAGPFRGSRVEEIASAAATARRAGKPDAQAVALAVAAGDPVAQRIWYETVDVLAGSLAALSSVVAPSAIVVGGGLALAGRLLLDPLSGRLAELLPGLRSPELRAAVHGDTAAARGAAMLAADRLAVPWPR